MPRHYRSQYFRHQRIEDNTPLPDFSDSGPLMLLVNRVGRILRHQHVDAPDSWTTIPNVRRSLRCLLTLRSLWLQIRDAWVLSVGILDSKAIRNFGECRGRLNGELDRQSGTNEGTCSARDTTTMFTTSEQIAKTAAAVRKSELIARTLDAYYAQCQHDFFDKLPFWSSLRKLCPIGGRRAYSVLLACQAGKLTELKNNEHKLFGWLSVDSAHTIASIRYAKANLIGHRLVKSEQHGNAPSLKAGRHHLTCDWTRYSLPDTSKAARIAAVANWTNRFELAILGLPDRSTAMTLALRQFKQYKEEQRRQQRTPSAFHGERFLRKIGVDTRLLSPATIITGQPERVILNHIPDSLHPELDTTRPTQDYFIPAAWSDSGVVVEGWVFARVGWPNVYHCDPATYHPVTGNPIAIEGLGKPTPNQVSTQLNLSSAYHFTQQQRALESQASKELRDKERKAVIARYMRHLRRIEVVTIKDSYDAGNCIPGTKQFCQSLRITDDTISGRRLAKLWMKSKYISQDRFMPVIKALVGKRENTLELVQLSDYVAPVPVPESLPESPSVVPPLNFEFVSDPAPQGESHVEEESSSIIEGSIIEEASQESHAETEGSQPISNTVGEGQLQPA